MSVRSSSVVSAGQRGTVLFMAPEALNDENFESSPLLKLCDIFSFGKTMWQLLHPTRSMQLSLPLRFSDDVPSDLKELVLQCTKEEPLERPQAMSEVMERLGRIRSVMEH